MAPPGGVLFTAGACPLDPEGQVVAPGDHQEQARVALANLLAVLAAHGCGPQHLVRTTIYVVGDGDDLVNVWEAIAPPRSAPVEGRQASFGDHLALGRPFDDVGRGPWLDGQGFR